MGNDKSNKLDVYDIDRTSAQRALLKMKAIEHKLKKQGKLKSFLVGSAKCNATPEFERLLIELQTPKQI